MAMKKCIYCDTVYSEAEEQCPLCGGTSADMITDEEPEVSFDSTKAYEPDLLIPAPAPKTEEKPKKEPNKEPKKEPKRRADPEPEKCEEDDDEPKGVVPRWMTAMICVVLAAALLVALAFTGYSLGLLDGKNKESEKDSLDLPIDEKLEEPAATDEQPSEEVAPPEDEHIPAVPDQDEQTQPTVPDEPDEPDVPDEPVPDEPDEPVEPDEPDEPVEPDEPEIVACTGISLDLTDVTLFNKGESFKLKAKVTPSDCNEPVVYKVSDPAYAEVDENGTVKALNGKGGDYITVTVSCGDYSEKCIVRLRFAETEPTVAAETTAKFSLNLTDFTMSHKNEEVALEVEGMNLATDTVTWTIDDPSVATITVRKDVAVVKAVASGTTTLHALVNGTEELSCIVRCSPKMGESAETAEQG